VFNDAKAAADDLRVLATTVAGARLRSTLELFRCEPDVQARLAQIVEDVLASKDGAAAAQVLSAHLRRIAALVRNAGATPVFVSYHVEQSSDGVMGAVATELGVALVGMHEGFERRLGPRRWEEVQAPDGHCNDEGYRMMAAIVADGLRDLGDALFREPCRP
jgi:lysophospholipase L1-like esterase